MIDRASFETYYPSKASLLVPLLHLLQKRDGYISERGIVEISKATGLSPAFIKGVYTFYSFYNSRPLGRYLIKICRNVACMAMGGDKLIEHLIKNHGFKEIGHGIFSYGPEPSAMSLMITECIGACAIGPAMLVNDTLKDREVTVGRLNREKIDEILKDLKEGSLPQPDNSIDVFPMRPESYLLRTLDCIDLSAYKAKGGYEAFRKVLQMKPEEVIDTVKSSGLKGRGGAGFPTGMKWAFARQDPKIPKYLIVNADEGEPGTFKDRILLTRTPHQIIEGMLIGGYAIGASMGYIYLRYEYPEVIPVLERAIEEARKAGLLGNNILGSGFSFDVAIHRGAGAYICGEETALIESLEGSRGQPRLRPPFPVNSGYKGKPTVVNNVETIANIPLIFNLGVENYSKIGSKDSPGPKLFSISGVKKPGVYEFPMGITLKEIIEIAGGPLSGTIKAIIPGGLSTPVLTKDMLDCPMDFTGPLRYRSMLGTGGLMVFGDEICMVRLAMRAMSFYRDESCGKCTPCREGTGWIEDILKRIEEGRAEEGDISLLKEISDNISGKTFCALGDGAAGVMEAILRYFEEEFKEHIRQGGCPFENKSGVLMEG